MSGVRMPRIASVSLLCLLLAAPLRAQQRGERGGHASFVAGVSLGDGNAALALTAALGFRFSARIGLDIELAHARKLDFAALMEGKASNPGAWPAAFRIEGADRPGMLHLGGGHYVRAREGADAKELAA